jgi:hypothetical protein
MAIKVNMRMLNIPPRTILEEGDKHYDSFKAWADNKDKRNGALICEVVCVKEDDGLKGLGKDALVALIAEFNAANPGCIIEYKGNASKIDLTELLEAAQSSLEEPAE